MILKPYVLEKTAIEKALHANECVRWIEAFIANLGHPLWGLQSMQELAPGMRNVLPFLIRDAKSCIDCEPHKGWPRFAQKEIPVKIFLLEILFPVRPTGFWNNWNPLISNW